MQELLPYLIATLGFLAIYVLNDIKGSIKEIKLTVKALEIDLRGGYSSLDRRTSDVEKDIALISLRCKIRQDDSHDCS